MRSGSYYWAAGKGQFWKQSWRAAFLPVSIVSANFSSPSNGWKLSPVSSVSFWLRHSLASCILLVIKLDQHMGSVPDAKKRARWFIFIRQDCDFGQMIFQWPLAKLHPYRFLVLAWAPFPGLWPPGRSFPAPKQPMAQWEWLSGWTLRSLQRGHLRSPRVHWVTEKWRGKAKTSQFWRVLFIINMKYSSFYI